MVGMRRDTGRRPELEHPLTAVKTTGSLRRALRIEGTLTWMPRSMRVVRRSGRSVVRVVSNTVAC